MNPYRAAFYPAQADWHGYKTKEDVLRDHSVRARYYRYWTRSWLPEDKSARCLDLACGAGQFVYFLKLSGYQNVAGVDLDAKQVKLAQLADLPCVSATIQDFLQKSDAPYDCISMLDILEHLTLEELFDVLTLVSQHMRSGSRLIFSVPNADSPFGFAVRHNDITHEQAFTRISLGELATSHGMEIRDIRDPYPAAIDLPRTIYRGIARISRAFEGLRIKACGLTPPAYWSPVIWGLAIKK